ncbi:hypothetical protein Dtox_2463 [Desulfofarcimen acetoxidans DSM 771]|uniref:Zinc finger, YgiT-type n=1 Tax=Desulfofarcimen acetoxidans (strain ATCC 49208 / DSM 771 / KCTC 5769 / VKM B-1644 / 5575) TaxID=485916 RepID=C8W0L7_DESAS|nr:hypothetical protein [Desulfofarcimen acetoxidans]ACV63272.1 hypothetical protein Dtox_2463 [Desulfofarcimen acetoxidans DSM 771]
MKKIIRCLECGQPAELKFEDRNVVENNKTFHLKGIPIYICKTCGEPTYDFQIELKLEEILDKLMKNEKREYIVNLTEIFSPMVEMTATLA